ncbi:MAG: SusC/RagA family TonB-linked outer membrane protein [Gemmatimonadaceae bacterium]|nr:SusC/RagA family TonB-linked outer membrane protein [Gemmatimonadaceae bacterium]
MTLVLLLLATTSATAQTRRISGRVTAEGTNEPIPSATISVVGTTSGGITDEQGRFSVSAPAGPVTLRVRRIGYAPRTTPVGAGLNDVNVSLRKDALELDKQVITGTATTVASVNSANAVAVVSSERLNRVPAHTIDQALQGKIAGAIITQNSGAPGGGTQIQLRGVSTINAGFSPLYVVDGIPVSNAAIQNGLNVITQSARASFGVNSPSPQDQQVNRIADLNPNDIENIQVLKGPSASSIYGSRGTNGVILITTKQGRAGKTTLDVTQRFGQSRISNTLDLKCYTSAEQVTADGWKSPGLDAAAFNAAPIKCHDYQREFYGNRDLSYQTLANLRGSTGGTNFFVSGVVAKDNGLGENDYKQEQSLRVNLSHLFGSKLNIRANSQLIHTLTQRGVFGNDNTGINPYTTFSLTPSFVELRKQPDGSFPRNPQSDVGNNNPFQNADRIKTPENVYRLIGSLQGVYNFMSTQSQTLDLTMTGGIDAYNDESRIISPADIYIEQINANPGTLVLNEGNIVNANLGGTLAHRLIGGAFVATTSVGFGQSRRNSNILNTIGRGVFPGVTSIGAAVQQFVLQTQDQVKDFSFFAQEEFLTLNERLLLTAAVNAERSSNNGDETKFYGYPKFSASYRIPEIIPKVSELKVRIAYGRAGNQPTAGKFTFLTQLYDEGRPGNRASTIRGFPDIKPETASELEGGFDLQGFDGRVTLSATQYRKQIDNLLLTTSLAPSTGFSTQWINGGQIVNHGTEIELGFTPIQTSRFEWVSQTTYASQKGKVTRLPVPGFISGPGSFGSRFGNGFIQLGQSPSVIQAVNGCTALSSTGTCPVANRVLSFVGDGLPDYVMGFSNDFAAGPVRLSTLVDWRKGSKGVNLTNNYFDGGLLADTALGNQRLRDFAAGKAAYIESTGFVKLREVRVSYEMPGGLVSSLFNGRAQSARIELSGRNLLTSTEYTGLDPEVSNFGTGALGRIQDVTPYPPSRTFYFTINTTF